MRGREIPARHPSVRRLRLCLLGAVLGAVLLCFPVGISLILGQGLPDPFIIFLYSKEQVDSLQALFNDPECSAALEERLAYSAIWHIGSTPESGGFKHVFFFAGRSRHTARLEGLVVRTVLEGGAYKVSAVSQEYSFKPLGSQPAIRDPRGFEVIRAAFNDPVVRASLLDFIRQRELNLHAFFVEPLPPDQRFRLSFAGSSGAGGETFVQNWAVQADPAGSGYDFSSE